MKSSATNKIKLGVFISISAFLFISGIYFIGKRQQMFSTTFHISCIFKDISGLQIGNNVRFSGINIGIVDNIQLITDSSVKVDMMLVESSRRFIKKSAIAIIGSDGLMGNKLVLIIPGVTNTHPLTNNDTLETSRTVSIDDILLKIKVTSDNAAVITTNLSAIVQNIRDGKGTVGKLLMDSSLAQNIDDALVNIKQGAGGFKDNMDAAGNNFLLRPFLKKKIRKNDSAK